MTRGIAVFFRKRRRLRAAVLGGVLLGATVLGGGPSAAITGGGNVNDGGFPFAVRLLLGDTERACTGALVHPQVVLTAKACFANASGAVAAGEPALVTTAVVGRAGTTGGTTGQVVDVLPHPDRDLALARLDTPAAATPIPIAAEAPAAGETITVAGAGRTAGEWVPDRLKYGRATVGAVAGATFELTGGAGICKGDAGGPAFRESGGTVELVGLHHDSNQAGCLGAPAGDPRAVETRLDDVRSWITDRFPAFRSGFESGQPNINWTNQVDDTGTGHGGIRNVTGVCCNLAGPELFIGSSHAHTGGNALLYSGRDTNATTSFAYTRAFRLKNLQVRPGTVLSYWIHPQSKAASFQYADGTNSTCVAVDLVFTDGSTLRGSGISDTRGNRLHPANQCAKMPLDTWTRVVAPIGQVAAGKSIRTLSIGYDQPANTGGYRGFVDDIELTDVIVPPAFASGLETGDPGPAWTNSVSATAPGGNLSNVTGVCCGLTGPELFVGTHTLPRPGSRALLYSGRDTSAERSWAYTRAFPLTDTFVTPGSKLSYWIYPQSKENSHTYADGTNSTCVAVDLILLNHQDNTRRALRDARLTDQRGAQVHPAAQCRKVTLDRWNYVTVPLGGALNGQEVVQVDIGYDQAPNTGGYRGFVDDIRITR